MFIHTSIFKKWILKKSQKKEFNDNKLISIGVKYRLVSIVIYILLSILLIILEELQKYYNLVWMLLGLAKIKTINKLLRCKSQLDPTINHSKFRKRVKLCIWPLVHVDYPGQISTRFHKNPFELSELGWDGVGNLEINMEYVNSCVVEW